MEDDIDLQVNYDQRGAKGGLPRHKSARNSGSGPRQARLWGWHQVEDASHAVWGTFPARFLRFALNEIGVPPGSRDVVHICSGTLPASTPGLRVDIRPDACPDVVADGRALPFADASFGAALIDPPWAQEYARDLYGTSYPRPSHLLAEASRVVRPGGRIGFVHFVVPNPPQGCRFVRVIGITQGCGYRIRALTIYQREPRGLFAEVR